MPQVDHVTESELRQRYFKQVANIKSYQETVRAQAETLRDVKASLEELTENPGYSALTVRNVLTACQVRIAAALNDDA